MNIYQIGQGGYLGAVAQIEPDAGCPAGFTRTEPPTIPEGSFAVWAGTGWEITDVAYVAPVFDNTPTIEQLKAQREAAVAAIKVTTAAGNTYDGDEVSINRLTAAITVLTATGGSVPWVLADNSIVTVNAAELTEALALAAAEVARLWVLPYAD